ncbi:MAG: hypothetical protein E3J76_04815 [Candidatus Aminicenantes bacterium]|nr:MAG: hypothetical protein E3J76_04815 [Candidatus Aminicenantes bacterium]
MKKFTKEEISLCKQVAERHVKEIHYGVWVAEDKRKTVEVSLWNLPIGLTEKQRKEGKWTPLWTISDCLEFLREKGFIIIQACEHPMTNEWIVEVNPYFSNAVEIMGHYSFDIRGDTLLIACLKAVLAVLEKD